MMCLDVFKKRLHVCPQTSSRFKKTSKSLCEMGKFMVKTRNFEKNELNESLTCIFYQNCLIWK